MPVKLFFFQYKIVNASDSRFSSGFLVNASFTPKILVPPRQEMGFICRYEMLSLKETFSGSGFLGRLSQFDVKEISFQIRTV